MRFRFFKASVTATVMAGNVFNRSGASLRLLSKNANNNAAATTVHDRFAVQVN